jgi:5-methylcytosine-specific restriction endonuclease McrA
MNPYVVKIIENSRPNRYQRICLSIIHRGISRGKETTKDNFGYCEGHHIIPKSFRMGGEKDQENIVYLSAKEHIMVHRLMCKFFSGVLKTKSQKAFHAMCLSG